MIIIGEKINGFIPATKKAIEERDEEYLKMLAEKQSEYGASYIDVCPGVAPEVERETMEWLMDLVQSTTDTPLCIDSPDPQVIVDSIPKANKVGLLNSVSMETGKCETIFPAAADTEWKIVALTCNDEGIPNDPETKVEIAQQIMDRAEKAGIAQERIFIDPLVTTFGSMPDAMESFVKAAKGIKRLYPNVTITSGLTNISHGMPMRKWFNMLFLTHAMAAGMTSAIMDPTSADMRTVIYATNALLGIDKRGIKFLKAKRKGIIG